MSDFSFSIVCITKFKLDSFADGGSKRSVQIREILQNNGIPFLNDPLLLPKNASKAQLTRWALRAVGFIRKHYPGRIRSLSAYVRLVKYYALRIPIVLDKYEDQDVVFLWENTTDRNMLYLLKATGHRVIGMPHNIESLVRSKSVGSLGAEVTNLKHCDSVFAISKEDTWLLRLFGLNAHYLPYYPPEEAESFMLSIRQKRESREARHGKVFALLGSATNIPTRSGMQSLVDFAAPRELSFDLLVAGFGTESLRQVSHPQISFLGTLSNEDLESVLVKIDGMIIYQPPTTGALTRIPEMLIAGIPVFANFDAARNYHNVDGVHVYSSMDELFSELEGFNPSMPDLFNRDKESESRFFSSLN